MKCIGFFNVSSGELVFSVSDNNDFSGLQVSTG